MRYLCLVTDFIHERLVTHLSAPELRLTKTMAQPKRIALACVVVLTALGWIALGLMASNLQPGWQVLCRPAGAAGLSGLAVIVPMWAAMILVMMLPTAGPMIVTYAEIADTATRQGEPAVSPLVLSAGYTAVWLGFAVIAGCAQWMLARQGLLDGGSVGRHVGGTVFLGAGLYQFSALKQSCLAECQRPFPFFFANWTTERAGVLRLGLRQGMFCLGCCWAMMLLTFAVGTMNVVWMAALGVLMTIEKLLTTPRFSKALGLVFATIGFGLIVWSVIQMGAGWT
jgi:predicted metal-binding membrane protein